MPLSISVVGRRSFHSVSARLIQVGDRLPNTVVHGKSPADQVNVQELFSKANKGIRFGVPGAFTPGCSKSHLPGYVKEAQALKKKGVDLTACVSVNDAFVTAAWGESQGATDQGIVMLADSKGELAKAMELDFDASGALGNHRFKRFAAIVEHGVVKELFVEPDNTGLSVSLVDNIKKHL